MPSPSLAPAAPPLSLDLDGLVIDLRDVPGRRPSVTVVVPTRNEEANVAPLVARISEQLEAFEAEVLFVDDSDDGTPAAIRQLAGRASVPVRLLHRRVGERAGGLGGAVQAGLGASTAEWVVVMDGDLQHPPAVVPQLLNMAASRELDLVVASRYVGEGQADGLSSPFRRMVSSGCTWAAKALFPRRLAQVSDPMSGFFAVRREAVEAVSLRPRGFKILLEILARSPLLRVGEVPFTFAPRHAGDSKASAQEMVRYLRQLLTLRWAASRATIARLVKFAVVGGSGIGINLLALYALLHLRGLGDAASAVVATQLAICWNFLLTELWVFRGRRSGRMWARASAFWAMNTAALAVQLPLASVLDRFTPMDYVRATFAALVVLALLRFTVCDLFLYRPFGHHPRHHVGGLNGQSAATV